MQQPWSQVFSDLSVAGHSPGHPKEGAAELSAGCELKQAPGRKERARRAKCVRCLISPLYSRAVILHLFFSTTDTAENTMKAVFFP